LCGIEWNHGNWAVASEVELVAERLAAYPPGLAIIFDFLLAFQKTFSYNFNSQIHQECVQAIFSESRKDEKNSLPFYFSAHLPRRLFSIACFWLGKWLCL
jgi:hypothetical protein